MANNLQPLGWLGSEVRRTSRPSASVACRYLSASHAHFTGKARELSSGGSGANLGLFVPSLPGEVVLGDERRSCRAVLAVAGGGAQVFLVQLGTVIRRRPQVGSASCLSLGGHRMRDAFYSLYD